jgi:fructosamine-3-kinase
VKTLHAVGGGCIHSTGRVSTSEGELFVKWSEVCAPDAFLREADGLRALRDAGSSLVFPEVLAAAAPEQGAPAFIAMEFLASGHRPDHDEVLGRGLAALHRSRDETFGFPVTTYCGPTAQDNTRAQSWPDFYAERRLLPLVRQLSSAGRLGSSERQLIERLCERLPGLIPRPMPPSLIHGDLWSGNVLATDRGPALVDPAPAYADREMEFGITTLFGGLPSRSFEAYQEAWRLPSDWRDRNALYQLYHLLNHYAIFGGSYGGAALAAARHYV